MIIYHHLDHDGNCAAAIVYHWAKRSSTWSSISRICPGPACGLEQGRIIFEGLDFNRSVQIEKIQPNEVVVIEDYQEDYLV